MRQMLRNNGLTLTLMAVFLLTWVGQWLAGSHVYNDELRHRGEPPVGAFAYLARGHFWQATGENWESEFLQMAMFVVLTCCLYQKGSPESKQPDEPDPVNDDPRDRRGDKAAPWPVRRGGAALWLYERSLSFAFAILFFASAVIHLFGGVRTFNEEQAAEGHAAVSALHFLGTGEFWFQSFQNWQSEFLSLAAMVYLSVFLRQRYSAESKPVATPHARQE